MKEILLDKGKSTLVDDEDFERLNAFRWYAHFHHGNWYARRSAYGQGKHKTLSMHRVILNAPKGAEVDHENGNGLDNQRHNVRLVTGAQNQFNAKLRKDSKSGFKGVSLHRSNGKRTGRWKAAIKCQGRSIQLGVFVNPEDAARAYDHKAMELRGKFARLNFPKEVAINE